MSEEQAIPNDPNSSPWTGDPNAPNAPNMPSPNNPQRAGQMGVGGGVDQTTGTPASPYEGPGYQGTRDPQPGGPGGEANLGQTAGAANPNAGAGGGSDLGAGLGGSGSGYGGPVSPAGEADMPGTDPGQADNASWAGQSQNNQGAQRQGSVNADQADTAYVSRSGSDEPDDVTSASQDSFPASDPPPFNPGRP